MKKNSALLALFGTVGAIILTVLYALLITGSAKLVFSLRLKGAVAFAILSNTATYIITAFIIFEVIFFIGLFTTLAKEKSDKQDGKMLGRISDNGKHRGKLSLATKISAVVGVVILLGMLVANFSVYTEVSETSIKKKSFFTTRQYCWDDVYRYSLTCDESADLKFTVQMKDSTSFEFFKNSNSCSDEFLDKYENMIAFARYLSDTFDSSERYIQKNVSGAEYMEKYYGEIDAWQDIRHIISDNTDDDFPNGDEAP